MLEEGTVNHKHWNEVIYPAIKSGTLKDRSKLLPHTSVYVHIILDCLIEDVDGKLYRCEGDIYDSVKIRLWKPNPNDDKTIRRYEEFMKNKN